MTSIYRNGITSRMHQDSFSESFAKVNTADTLTDEELLCQTDRTESAMQLYDRYAAIACGIATRIVRDQTVAEDVVESAFLDLWREAKALAATKAPVVGWLALRVRQLAIAMVQGHLTAPAPVLPQRYDTSAMPNPAALTQQAQRAAEGIPAEKRRAATIAFFDGIPPREIALLTGDSVTTVISGIRASLLTLRKGVHA